MDNKIVLCLMYDTEKVTLDIMKDWCDTVCQCFEPEKMICDGKIAGYSNRYEGIWFGSCYQMWFGRLYYEYINKEKLQNFHNCYENVELGNDALRITLYEDIWDFGNPINRKRQWKFRKSVGIDKVAHALLKKPKKYRRSIDPHVEFENKIENGVEYHLVVNYADKNDKPIEKTKVAKKITYVYVKGKNEPIDILKESI